jgi:hypothetical protein
MKSLVMAIMANMAVASLSAADTLSSVVDKEEQGRINREKFIKATGGFIIDKRNAVGHASIINSQKRLKKSFLKAKATALEKNVWFFVKYFEPSGPITLGGIRDAVKESGGKASVVLLEAENLPTLLVLPESRCAIVNVTELAKGCKDDAALEERATKEITRGFCFAFGSGYSSRAGGVMDPIISHDELDQILVDVIGLDILPAVSRSAEQFGIGRFKRTTYLKACEEGWAPAPTNDVQKAIWDKVHAMPTEPLKIKPETTKVNE